MLELKVRVIDFAQNLAYYFDFDESLFLAWKVGINRIWRKEFCIIYGIKGGVRKSSSYTFLINIKMTNYVIRKIATYFLNYISMYSKSYSQIIGIVFQKIIVFTCIFPLKKRYCFNSKLVHVIIINIYWSEAEPKSLRSVPLTFIIRNKTISFPMRQC